MTDKTQSIRTRHTGVLPVPGHPVGRDRPVLRKPRPMARAVVGTRYDLTGPARNAILARVAKAAPQSTVETARAGRLTADLRRTHRVMKDTIQGRPTVNDPAVCHTIHRVLAKDPAAVNAALRSLRDRVQVSA